MERVTTEVDSSSATAVDLAPFHRDGQPTLSSVFGLPTYATKSIVRPRHEKEPKSDSESDDRSDQREIEQGSFHTAILARSCPEMSYTRTDVAQQEKTSWTLLRSKINGGSLPLEPVSRLGLGDRLCFDR